MNKAGLLVNFALPVTAGVCMILSFGGISCGKSPYVPPKATIILNAAPIQVESDALYDEWAANPESTLTKYSMREIYFKTIIVEELSLSTDADGPFMRIGHIKCYATRDLEKVKVGDPVDVVGKLKGIDGESLIISDCWVRIVDTRKPQGY